MTLLCTCIWATQTIRCHTLRQSLRNPPFTNCLHAQIPTRNIWATSLLSRDLSWSQRTAQAKSWQSSQLSLTQDWTTTTLGWSGSWTTQWKSWWHVAFWALESSSTTSTKTKWKHLWAKTAAKVEETKTSRLGHRTDSGLRARTTWFGRDRTTRVVTLMTEGAMSWSRTIEDEMACLRVVTTATDSTSRTLSWTRCSSSLPPWKTKLGAKEATWPRWWNSWTSCHSRLRWWARWPTTRWPRVRPGNRTAMKTMFDLMELIWLTRVGGSKEESER